jgi:hypothetical protein
MDYRRSQVDETRRDAGQVLAAPKMKGLPAGNVSRPFQLSSMSNSFKVGKSVKEKDDSDG